MFFDDYPRFAETSPVAGSRARLNLRYEALFADNRDIFRGARVLDLASHDGRWSFAALRTGASHVTGIEARPQLVDAARETFAGYGQPPDSYRFICSDVFAALQGERFEVDVVLCLGFLYHTYRHAELLSHIRRVDPTYLLVDCNVLPHVDEPLVRLRLDDPDEPADAVSDTYSHRSRTVAGIPSAAALTLLLDAYEFPTEHTYEWGFLTHDHPHIAHLRDYARGARVTVRCGPDGRAAHHEASVGSGAPSPDAAAPAQPCPNDRVSGHPGTPAPRSARWRERLNRALSSVSGYELRRAARSG